MKHSDKIISWLMSALISSAVPFIMLGILYLLPALREYGIFWKSHYSFPLDRYQTVKGIYLTFITSTTLAYLGARLMISLSSSDASEWSDWRRETADNFQLFAWAGLFYIIPLLSMIWALAIDGGNVPEGPWGVYGGNHGPWRLEYPLRYFMHYTILLPFFLSFFGLLSFIIKPGKLAAFAVLCNIMAFFGLLWSHYWLID